MTSLLPAPRQTRGQTRGLTRGDRTGADGTAAHRRPLVLLAGLAGLASAAATLVVCLAAGVVGWFLTDAGAHGQPRDGLRVGALGWLAAHGSGVRVDGVAVTAVPLGLSLLAAVVVWRMGLRLGDSVSGHGPDADAIADGVRDWTVPAATGVFTLGYAVVVVATDHVAATAATAPSLAGALTWSVLLCLLVGGSAVAVGSGRAAIWTSFVPLSVRLAVAAAWRVSIWYAVTATALLLASLAVHWNDAANVLSQLHTGAGAATVLIAVCVLVVPNAAAASGSYLLGPGFAVGTHTLVTPTAVVLGPLPMFPLLGALPHDGTPPAWTAALLVVPPLVAAVATYRVLRPGATLRWDEAALRGLGAGLVAAVGFAIVCWLAGGAVGPGRMQDVGPHVFPVLLHGIAAFGLGGLVGSATATLVARRRDL